MEFVILVALGDFLGLFDFLLFHALGLATANWSTIKLNLK